MKGLITGRLKWQGRALAVLMVTLAVLALLLSTWVGSLSTAEAREMVLSAPEESQSALPQQQTGDQFIYLPFVAKSDLVFFDDFSSTSSGWPHRVTFEDCYFEYSGGTYRVKVTSKNQECIIPNFNIPKQVNGTFSVRARRTSNEDYPMLYGLIFGAGTDAIENRWALEVYPNNDSDCSNKPFYWLYALVNGSRKFFEDRCTDSIDTDEDDWNELKIIRNGSNIKVYINGESKGEYSNASYLLDQGYSLLRVVSASDEDISVEFDDFRITQKTTP